MPMPHQFMNANDLFAQFFSKIPNQDHNSRVFMGGIPINLMTNMPNVRIMPIQRGPTTNVTMSSTSIQIVNGKKIQTITERINGTTRTKTIITDL